MDGLYGRPGYLLKRCHQVAAAIFIEECREFNMTPSQFGALMVFREFPGIDQIAMGRLTGLDRSTAGLVVKLLAERELIERCINLKDKRRMNIRLTEKGEQMLAAMASATERAQERVLAGLPPKSRAAFISLLEDFLIGHGATIDPAEVLATAAPAVSGKTSA